MSELAGDITRDVTALAREQIAALRDHSDRAGTRAAKHEARALSQQVVRGVQRWHDRQDNLMAIVKTMRATVAYVDRVERQVAMRRLRQKTVRRLHQKAAAAKLQEREFWVQGADLQQLRAEIDRWQAADPTNSYRRLARAAGLHPIDVSRAHKVNRCRVNWHTASAIWEAIAGGVTTFGDAGRARHDAGVLSEPISSPTGRRGASLPGAAAANPGANRGA